MFYKVSCALTNKLWCSRCKRKIKIGEKILFELEQNYDSGKVRMVNCECEMCGFNIITEMEEDDILNEVFEFGM